jgi:hypothetical protein
MWKNVVKKFNISTNRNSLYTFIKQQQMKTKWCERILRMVCSQYNFYTFYTIEIYLPMYVMFNKISNKISYNDFKY